MSGALAAFPKADYILHANPSDVWRVADTFQETILTEPEYMVLTHVVTSGTHRISYWRSYLYDARLPWVNWGPPHMPRWGTPEHEFRPHTKLSGLVCEDITLPELGSVAASAVVPTRH